MYLFRHFGADLFRLLFTVATKVTSLYVESGVNDVATREAAERRVCGRRRRHSMTK